MTLKQRHQNSFAAKWLESEHALPQYTDSFA